MRFGAVKRLDNSQCFVPPKCLVCDTGVRRSFVTSSSLCGGDGAFYDMTVNERVENKMQNVFKCLLVSAALLGSTQVFAGGDINAGKEKSALCVACHGQNGMGIGPLFPNLAGQKSAYIEKQLKAFKAGDRVDPNMTTFAKMLSDADIANLAAYYESLPHK